MGALAHLVETRALPSDETLLCSSRQTWSGAPVAHFFEVAEAQGAVVKPLIHNPKTLIRKHQAPAHKPNPKSTYLSIHLSLFLPFLYNRSMYFPVSLTIYQCIHPIIPQSSIYPCVRDRSIYLPKPEPTNIKPKSTDLKPLIHNPKTLIRKHQAPAHKPNPKSTYLSIHLSLFLPFLYNRSMYFPISLTIYQCIHPIIPQSIVNLSMCA